MIKKNILKYIYVPLILGIVLSLLCGCTNTYYISRNDVLCRNNMLTAAQFNQEVEKRIVDVELIDGRKCRASQLTVSNDSVHFVDTIRHEPVSVEKGYVESIQWNSRTRGGIDGCVVFAIPAVFAGAIMASGPQFGGGSHPNAGGLIVIPLVTGLGYIPGALIGEIQCYKFASDTCHTFYPHPIPLPKGEGEP
jgi:hypothetical protein